MPVGLVWDAGLLAFMGSPAFRQVQFVVNVT